MPSPWQPSFEPVFVVAAGLAVWIYVRAWRTHPGRRRHAWLFGTGIALVVVSLNSPLGTIATNYLVLFHLLQNVIIGDWAPPLLLLGLTPGMRAALGSHRLVARLVRPQVALPVWLVGWYVIHLAPVYDLAVRNAELLAIEHAVLIGIGLVFWWPVLLDVPRAVPTLLRIGYVLAAFAGSAFLGLALTFAPPVYSFYDELPTRLWGISATQDQNLGGILMSTEQALVVFAAIAWLLIRLFREEAEAEARLTASQRHLRETTPEPAVPLGHGPGSDPGTRP
jgi:cytochrome c oxidase assembly factor CtaG